MGLSINTLDRADISTIPIKVKYPTTYLSGSLSNYGITVNKGINATFKDSGSQFLNYKLVQQLYYNEYVTGSLLTSASYWNDSLQSTAAKGTFDNDYRYFPTESNSSVTIFAIPRTSFGEKISRNSFLLSGSTYRLIDDGNGNIKDIRVTGSQQSSYSAFTNQGVRLYSSGYNVNGIGAYLEWNTANVGGSYTGTFWTNPSENSIDGRLNYSGLWSNESQYYVGQGVLTFTISSATDKTYYFGIGCDDYSSLYVDDLLVIDQPYVGGPGTHLRYWSIYPISISSGSHEIIYIGNNAGVYDLGNNPGSMGIEIYDNTFTQISASITASPNGSSTPAGISILYSSKDHLSEGVFAKNDHVGNILYSQGVLVITNKQYQDIFIRPEPAIVNWTRANYENNGFIVDYLVIIYTNYYTGIQTTLTVPSGGTGTPPDAGSLTVEAGSTVLVSAQNSGFNNIYYILTSAAINSSVNGNLVSVNIPIGSSAYTASEQSFTAISGVTYAVDTYGSGTLP